MLKTYDAPDGGRSNQRDCPAAEETIQRPERAAVVRFSVQV
jgi:hypothetical protein